MNERIVCLDIGDVRIGVAVSDPSRTIASPVDLIVRVGFGPDVKKIKAICDRYETNLVLSGLPLNMDGTAGFQSEKVKALCAQLEKAGLRVLWQDERLTTVTATQYLLEDNMHRAERKKNVDKVSAAVILRQYLDSGCPGLNDGGEAAEKPAERKQNMIEQNDNIIELEDENGEPIAFEHLATLEKDGTFYLALTPAEPEEGEEEGGVFFMSVEEDEEGECYVPVEDEDLEAVLFDDFMKLVNENEQ